MANKFQFEKLNARNYFTWKFRMEHYLKAEKLWNAIVTDEPEIKSTVCGSISNQAELTKWSDDDEQALARIVLCIDNTQVTHLRTAESARDAWDALKEYHEKDTLTNRICIMRRIRSTKLVEGGNIEQHINDMTDMFQKLADLGDKLIDIWKVALLLSSLPSSYDTLVTALELR